MRGKKTGGRKPGSRNKSTVFREQLATEGYKSALESGIMPLEVIFRVMKGGPEAAGITERMFDAAKAALPFCHPRLTATYVSASYSARGTMCHEDRLKWLEDLEAPSNVETQVEWLPPPGPGSS